MIRYHSFYAGPPRGGVRPPDERPRPRDVRLGARRSTPTTSTPRPTKSPTWKLRPYYEELIAEYFPPVVKW